MLSLGYPCRDPSLELDGRHKVVDGDRAAKTTLPRSIEPTWMITRIHILQYTHVLYPNTHFAYTHVLYMSYTCPAHMSYTHVVYKSCTCHIHVTHTCPIHVYMSYTHVLHTCPIHVIYTCARQAGLRIIDSDAAARMSVNTPMCKSIHMPVHIPMHMSTHMADTYTPWQTRRRPVMLAF